MKTMIDISRTKTIKGEGSILSCVGEWLLERTIILSHRHVR